MEKEVSFLNTYANLKQSNNLVEAKYRLTKYEQRMVIAICSQLTNEQEFPKIRINIKDLANFCKFDPTNKTDMVRTTARKLRSRTLECKKPDGLWYITGWINSADLNSDGTIEFSIDPKLAPQLLQLKSAYLSTPALPLMEFKRDYSARLYFLLKKMIKVGEFEYSLDFIRERFQLGKSYEIFFNLKNKVFEPALAEINKLSDITVEHEYIKEGRSYKRIRFKVSLKEKNPEQNLLPVPTPDPVPDDPPPLEEEEKEIIRRLAKYEIAPDYSKKMLKRYGVDQIDRNLKYAYAHRQRKENMAGWIIDCIKNDRSLDAEEAKKVSTKAEKAKTDEMMKRLEPIPKPSKEVPKDSPFLKFARKKD